MTELKRETQELCKTLDALGEQLADGSVALADVKSDFESRYQPKALALVDALTARVPPDTPGISVSYADGYRRLVIFPDRQCLSTALPGNDTADVAMHASVQFKTMAFILRKLASSLPEEPTKR
jgi:hypothetical protein